MERRAAADPDRDLARSGDELEERIDKLDEHIDDSKRELRARREDTDPGEDVAGDWEDTEDDAGGEDPAGFDDPERVEDEEEDF
jgi:hypothetical protein